MNAAFILKEMSLKRGTEPLRMWAQESSEQTAASRRKTHNSNSSQRKNTAQRYVPCKIHEAYVRCQVWGKQTASTAHTHTWARSPSYLYSQVKAASSNFFITSPTPLVGWASMGLSGTPANNKQQNIKYIYETKQGKYGLACFISYKPVQKLISCVLIYHIFT